MKNLLHSKKIFPALVALAAAALLAACGGGGDATSEPEVDPVAETERQQALGLFDKLPVSWAPTQLVFDLNPGSRQTVPVTLTTTKALKNAKIVFVPDLRNAVTVSPEVIPSLAAGQSVTVTLTFAPAAADKRKLIAGVVLLFDKSATISKPLPVKVSLVRAATINGVVVPPEPPAELNNATLAGFDVNGNGVRDDVERQIAEKVSSALQFSNALDIATYYQTFATIGANSQSKSQSDAMLLRMICAAVRTAPSLTSRDIQGMTLNSTDRSRQFRLNTVALGGIAVDTDQACK